MGEELGLEKISLKNDNLRAYFVSGKNDYFKSEIFGKILAFVQSHPKQCRMKDTSGKLILTIEKIMSVESALTILDKVTDYSFRLASEIESK
jgi:transcription-repair coupling factor (superfamily II helicase)